MRVCPVYLPGSYKETELGNLDTSLCDMDCNKEILIIVCSYLKVQNIFLLAFEQSSHKSCIEYRAYYIVFKEQKNSFLWLWFQPEQTFSQTWARMWISTV